MKWFFALNEHGNDFENYSKLLKVAVHTAQKFTSLEPFFLYDGQKNLLTEWLEKRNVTIINCRTFLYDKLKTAAAENSRDDYFTIGSGAFLRTEIPRLTAEMQITDKFVLYTDLDVMFLGEVVRDLQKLSPRYFAVAPEFSPKHFNLMNSGVMLMNLKNLRANDEEFKEFIVANLPDLINAQWDQSAYKSFYKGRFYGYKWSKLAPKFNWKPYWGDYAKAKIIHFHGAKPTQKQILLSNEIPENLKTLLPLLRGKYFELCELWEKFYAEAEDANSTA